jgi:hypothetical protein
VISDPEPYDPVIFKPTRVRHTFSRWPVTRVVAGVAAALMALAVASAPSARAASLPGPAVFTTGLADDPAFQSNSVRSVWLTRAQQLGSTMVRIGIAWNTIAPLDMPSGGFNASNPRDPHYNWTNLDATIRAATAHGQTVLLQVNRAPNWAEGPNRPGYVQQGAWDPNPQDLATFAGVLAQRYSGTFRVQPSGPALPRVSDFQAWNEPNLPEYLMPQWVRGAHGSIVPESPVIYRSLLNAFYAAIKQVQPDAFVLAAGTAPYGDAPGVDRMEPIVFLREMFCLTSGLRAEPCPDPPHFDALDHHPYAVDPMAKAVQPNDVGVPDLGKIFRVLHAAQRVGHALPVGPKSLWITEFDWASNPPSQQAFSLSVQAQFTSLALYDFWRQGVSHAFWFQLRDPLVPNSIFTGAGLYFANGVAKPAAAAFRFPFVATPVTGRRHLITIWGRAPVAGTVVISRRVGKGWHRVLRLTTTSGGVFYTQRRLATNLTLQAAVGTVTSPAWDERTLAP